MANKAYVRSGGTWVEIGATSAVIQDATTAQKGQVQLTDSTSSTSTTTAATPNSVKTAYDAAVASVQPSRTLTGTSPITIDGVNTAVDLSANRTIAVAAASTSISGVVTLTANTPQPTSYAGSVGSATTVARSNHVHQGVPSISGSTNQIDAVTDGAPSGTGAVSLSIPNLAETSNWVGKTSVTVTAGGSSTITSGGAYNRVFTGTSTHTVALPDTTVAGQPNLAYRFINNSTGNITVNTFGGSLVTTLAGGEMALITQVTGGSTAAAWHVFKYPSTPSSAWGTANSMTLLASAVSSSSSLVVTGIPTTYKDIYIRVHGLSASSAIRIESLDADTGNISNIYQAVTKIDNDATYTSTTIEGIIASSTTSAATQSFPAATTAMVEVDSSTYGYTLEVHLFDYANASGLNNATRYFKHVSISPNGATSPTNASLIVGQGRYTLATATAAITSFTINNAGGVAMTAYVYGVS